jgi:DNA replication and repair protein RecF
MRIKSLRLQDFRNYDDRTINFSDKVNIIVGKNAQGKTNILEAIFFLVIGKSFRSPKEKEVIKWDKESGKINGTFAKKYRDIDIEMIFSQKQKKIIKIDSIGIRKIGELLGSVNAVFFSPSELRLVKDSPDERRRFMNVILSQTDKRYFYLLERYEKVLANRNKLLKNSMDINALKDTIDIWDRALSELAEKIYKARTTLISELTPYAKKAHEFLSSGKEKLDLVYQSSFVGEDYAKKMMKYLEKNIEKDFKLGYTSVGVHRDEIDIFLNGVEVKSFGSQGQQRTTALSLKLAELEIIKNRTGEEPILLLDDVFSELDSDRRKKLLKFTSKAQTIITCTDFDENIEELQPNIIKI